MSLCILLPIHREDTNLWVNFFFEKLSLTLLKGSPPWPTWCGKAVSPCPVISLKEKCCWLCTHTSSSCWHFWAPKADTGCFKRALGHADRWAGGSVCQRNGMCFRVWVTGPEYSPRDISTAAWAGCPHMRLKGCPITSPQHHGVIWIRHLTFMWCLYGKSTVLTLPN